MSWNQSSLENVRVASGPHNEGHVMPRGRPHKAALVVCDEDRAELLRWTKRAKSSNGLAQRAPCGCRPKAPQIRRTVVSEELPRDATHWNTRAMAEQSGLSLGSWSAPPPPARLIAAPVPWKTPFVSTRLSTTRSPSPSCGSRPPTKFSAASADFICEPRFQDTRAASRIHVQHPSRLCSESGPEGAPGGGRGGLHVDVALAL